MIIKPYQTIEIHYNVKDKGNGWFYYGSSKDKYDLAVKDAEKHFRKLCENSGWKGVTILETRLQKKANEIPPSLTVSPTDLTPARRKSGLDRSKASTAKTRTRKASKTTTSQRKRSTSPRSKTKSNNQTPKRKET